MSLEWSTLNECFSSPLQDLNCHTQRTNNWSNLDKTSTTSVPYQIDVGSPNVALAEDAFRQIVSHESQYLAEEQPNEHIACNNMGQPTYPPSQETCNTQPPTYTTDISIVPDINNSLGFPSNSNFNSPQQQVSSDSIRHELKGVCQPCLDSRQPNISQTIYKTPSNTYQNHTNNPNTYKNNNPNHYNTNNQNTYNTNPNNRNTYNTNPNNRNTYNTNNPYTRSINSTPALRHGVTNNSTNQETRYISPKDEETQWLTILIVFVSFFLIMACR